MAALVTIAEAKDHLRITSNDSDQDIDGKVELASAIVLASLNGTVITSSSVASPTVMTTQKSHRFATGDTVLIAGHAGSTPTINGSQVVTVLTPTTFTVPVAVTVAGTGGVVTTPWTDATVPGPIKTAVLLMLTHLYEHRGDDMQADADLWEAIGRVLRPTGYRDPALA